MAKSCSGFCPSPLPPIALGVAICTSSGASPFDRTMPLRPAPCAVAFEKYCVAHVQPQKRGLGEQTYDVVLDGKDFLGERRGRVRDAAHGGACHTAAEEGPAGDLGEVHRICNK